MKRGLSTGKPTKREAERIVACKEGPCIACMVLSQRDGDYKVGLLSTDATTITCSVVVAGEAIGSGWGYVHGTIVASLISTPMLLK